MKIYRPDGAVGQSSTPLARWPRLHGARVVVLDNGKPGADVLLDRMANGLATRAGALHAGMLRKGSAATPCEESLLEEIKARADVALTGTAD